jgi:hypothetical protein
MEDRMNVTSIFNKFAGREIAVVETQQTLDIGGETYTFNEVDFANPNDPTIKAMEKAAKDHGLHLRLWLPGSAGTADYRTDRVNAYVEKAADGKYRVTSKFGIG